MHTQRIEELTGKKMVLYPTEEDMVLQLADRVGEAQVSFCLFIGFNGVRGQAGV